MFFPVSLKRICSHLGIPSGPALQTFLELAFSQEPGCVNRNEPWHLSQKSSCRKRQLEMSTGTAVQLGESVNLSKHGLESVSPPLHAPPLLLPPLAPYLQEQRNPLHRLLKSYEESGGRTSKPSGSALPVPPSVLKVNSCWNLVTCSGRILELECALNHRLKRALTLSFTLQLPRPGAGFRLLVTVSESPCNQIDPCGAVNLPTPGGLVRQEGLPLSAGCP
ncbi:uncharacterized protein LOC104863939 [Fukomys damarensis]|uniref:uncharacterized protein LOC104863939 n=1 Tax=Fukomys damarensis TaxID=885580 RepID=UPI00053F8B19|nr:uncharacterized protein LOC104863939 [Fukomys damarensis]XP_010624929.1 uncharacterized protein LOC104863939 [Fukomys damarensis]